MDLWDQSRQPKTYILFLDTGDICRCPMAKGILNRLLEERGLKHIEIMTAGVMTTPSILPTAETRLLLKEAQIDIGRYRSSQYSEALIKKADLVLGMSPFHVQKAMRLTSDARRKTYLLKEYAKSDMKNVQIPDPMGATLEVYRRVFREIRAACERLIDMDIVRLPKPAERDSVPTERRKPARMLSLDTRRKLIAPRAASALLDVMAAEQAARREAQNFGFPVSSTEQEIQEELARRSVEARTAGPHPEVAAVVPEAHVEKAGGAAKGSPAKGKSASGATGAAAGAAPKKEKAAPKKEAAAKPAKSESAKKTAVKPTGKPVKKAAAKSAAAKPSKKKAEKPAKSGAKKKPAERKPAEKKAPKKAATAKKSGGGGKSEKKKGDKKKSPRKK